MRSWRPSVPGGASRRRRVMFSTSITASSTTTPRATTRPPRLIVLSEMPRLMRTHTVASSDTGIELNEISAPRQSRSVTSSSATTSAAPTRSELRSFAIALSMKLAGLRSAGWYCTPCAASGEAVLERVGHLEGIGAKLGRGLHEYARAPADHRIAEARRRAVQHRGDIADAQRHARARRDQRLGERLWRIGGRLGLQDDALGGGLQVAATDEIGPAARRLVHLVERYPGGLQSDRVDQQLSFPGIAAEDLRLRDAGNGQNLRLHRPADEVEQLHRREPIAR